VACPKCQAKYRLTHAVPENGLTFDCSVCRAKLFVRPKAPTASRPNPVGHFEPTGLGDLTGPNGLTGLGGLTDPNGLTDLTGLTGPTGHDGLTGPAGATVSGGLASPDGLAFQRNAPDPSEPVGLADDSLGQSREVFCPSCLKPYMAHLANGQDEWIDCPNCGEKFLAQANPAWVTPSPWSKEPGFKPTKAKSRLVLKVDSMAQLREIGFLENAPGQKRKLLLAAVAVVAIGLFLFLFLLVTSWRNAQSLAEASAPPRGSPLEAYEEKDFKKDLLNFYHWSRDKFLSNYTIDYSGHSSRLFKYSMARLAPQECQEFSKLTLNAVSKAGIKILGHCYDSRRPNPVIFVNWKGRQAILSTPESAETLHVEIYPAPVAAANPQ
jgi:DNA-directed RNA polymerase subunit RPC12/RpoP